MRVYESRNVEDRIGTSRTSVVTRRVSPTYTSGGKKKSKCSKIKYKNEQRHSEKPQGFKVLDLSEVRNNCVSSVMPRKRSRQEDDNVSPLDLDDSRHKGKLDFLNDYLDLNKNQPSKTSPPSTSYKFSLKKLSPQQTTSQPCRNNQPNYHTTTAISKPSKMSLDLNDLKGKMEKAKNLENLKDFMEVSPDISIIQAIESPQDMDQIEIEDGFKLSHDTQSFTIKHPSTSISSCLSKFTGMPNTGRSDNQMQNKENLLSEYESNR